MKRIENRWKVGDRTPRIGDWVVCIFDWTPSGLVRERDRPYFKNCIGRVIGPLKYSHEPTMLKIKWFTDKGEVEWPTHIDRFKVIGFEEKDI